MEYLFSEDCWIRVRERRPHPANKIQWKAFLSEQHFGVDNTGNTRVWDSESTLTYCLRQAIYSRSGECLFGKVGCRIFVETGR